MTKSERIRRGGTSNRLSVKDAPRAARQVKKAAGKTALGRSVARLPISAEAMQRGMTWGIVALSLAGLWGVASFFGLPGMARMELAEVAAHSGYEVEKVEVHGTKRMDAKSVYDIALGQVDRSMLNVDLAAVRAEIVRLPWVSDARVSRRLPDTLVVDIVERTPAAVWQHQGRLALIDANGVVLEAVSPQAMPDLPLLVGEAANGQADRLAKLMEAAPALKSLLAGATWVGNRRWDLRFQSGETLALPEGDAQAAAALVNFARLDGVNHLLGRGVLRFDLRDPARMVMRMPEGRAAPAVPADNAASPAQGDAAETTKPEAALPQALASREEG
jgi:cell division protein FtsQ